jgi:hypothetical protein
MGRLVLFTALLILFAGGACTPGLAESNGTIGEDSAGTFATPTIAIPTSRSPVKQAEAIIGERFSGLGWIEMIVRIEYKDQQIRLTMDRDTFTLGNLESFSRMCQALTELIGVDGPDGDVIGVQTYRADGSPVVAGTKPGERCVPF